MDLSTESRINRRVEHFKARLNLSTEPQTPVSTILHAEDNTLAAAWKEIHDRIAALPVHCRQRR